MNSGWYCLSIAKSCARFRGESNAIGETGKGGHP